jgi:diguanylate cyclase (GGDEF)-like protein
LISKHLLQGGYEVLTAKDGKEALAVALEHVPDIVVADYLMPEIDGLDLCRALRKTVAGSKMYFLLVTGRDDPEALIEAFESGVDDFVTKPFVPRLLHARIKGGVRLVRLQRKVEEDRRVMERQMAELSVLTRKLRNAAMTDALTSLPNRRYAMKRLEGEWAFSSRTGRPLCLIMIDIDHFKSVNDQHGHDVGDIVLRETAHVLKNTIRDSDEVCRLGGEEFLVICRNTSEEEGLLVAERLRRAVDGHVVEGNGFGRNVTISLGAASSEDFPAGFAAVLKGADLAVYEAKRSGRNRFSSASTLFRGAGSDDLTAGLGRESA